MKTFKFSFTAVAAIAAVLLSFALSLTGCPPGEEGEDPGKTDPDKPKTGENFKIEGKYHFINDTTKVVYNWEFTDKTFEIVWKQSNLDRNKKGTYSVSGDDVSLKLDAEAGVSFPQEVYTASKTGDKVTLTLKDASAQVSMLSSGVYLINSKTLTLTVGEGEVKPEEFTALHMGTTWTYIIEGEGNSRTITLTDCELTWESLPQVAAPSELSWVGNVLYTLTLPSTLANLPVTAINNKTIASSFNFDNGAIATQSIIIPDSIKRIGNPEANTNTYYWGYTVKITIGAGVDIQAVLGSGNRRSLFNSYYNSNGRQKGVYCLLSGDRNGSFLSWEKAN